MDVLLIKHFLFILLIQVTFFELYSCGIAIGRTPIIKTNLGKVVGEIERYSIGDVAYFFGIPYGKPPIGELRFAKTQPAESWNDIFEATEEASYCYEPITSARFVRKKYSEDCLTITIAIPPKALQEPGSRPVIVDMGRDNSANTYDGYITEYYPLVIKQDLILVRINSRRNIFGFAYTMADNELNGNYGLWDQNMGLHWIKDNIKNFGGDPNKITIFGSGSGGQLSVAHLASPYSRGLFENVIIQSRSLFTLNSNVNERVDESTNIVIKRVGCTNAKNVRDCLRQKDPQELIDAIPNRWEAFVPVLDSDYIPLMTGEISAHGQGEVATDRPNINVLLGYSQGEASLQLSQIAPNIFSDTKLTTKDALEVIEMLFKKEAVDKVAEIYLGDANQPLSISKIQNGLTKLINDITITCPLVLTGIGTSTGQKEGQTYFFVFNHLVNWHANSLCNSQYEEGICPLDNVSVEYGIAYTDEFGHKYSDEDRKITDKLQNIFGTFARTGKPPMSPNEWPSYNSKPDKYPALILTSKKDTLDYSIGKYCVENAKFLDDSLIDPKYYPLDEYTIPKQKKVDYKSNLKNILRNQLYYAAFQNY
ncbi:acetylcholinesterase-like [Brevipalpus obovatus]|uniref:acetylcholinesterase-like n=1 Tax=Brevipalpus obovatus TaxID=246614 RepID=UPI003D9E7986